MRALLPALTVLLLLSACSDRPERPAQSDKDKAQAQREQRMKSAEVALSRTPVPRSYQINGNELLVLNIPTSDGRGHLDAQRCFVFRDTEFKTTSIQCPADPIGEVLPSSPGAAGATDGSPNY